MRIYRIVLDVYNSRSNDPMVRVSVRIPAIDRNHAFAKLGWCVFATEEGEVWPVDKPWPGTLNMSDGHRWFAFREWFVVSVRSLGPVKVSADA